MQATDRRPTPALIFDTSIDSIGQVLAASLVFVYESRREARLTSFSVSRNNLKVAAFCDLLARFHGTPVSIGMFEGGAPSTAVSAMITAVLAKQTEEQKNAYPRSIERFIDTADPVALIRNALTAQQDQNSTILLSGPPTNLQGLLALPGTAQLIQKKVRVLIVAPPLDGGEALDKLLAVWPSPVTLLAPTEDPGLQFPAQSFDTDFAWAPQHPLVDAYRAAMPMPYDAPAHTMTAAQYAVHPEDAAFKLSEPGHATVTTASAIRFQPDPKGRHRQLLVDPVQKERLIQALREIVSAKPPEPRRGARGGQP